MYIAADGHYYITVQSGSSQQAILVHGMLLDDLFDEYMHRNERFLYILSVVEIGIDTFEYLAENHFTDDTTYIGETNHVNLDF